MVRQKLSPAVNSLPCSGYPTGTRATQDEDHCRPWGRVTIVQNGGFGESRVNYPKWARVWKQWSTSILKRGLHSGCWNEHSNLRLVLGSMLCQDGRQQARLEIAVNPVGHLRHYQSWLWQSLLGSLSDGKSEAENRTGFKLVLKSASGRSRPLKGLGKSSSASPNLWVRSFACVAKRGCQDVWLLHQLHQAQTNSCSKPDFSGSRAQKRTKSPATLGVTLFLVAWLKASSTHGKTSGSWNLGSGLQWIKEDVAKSSLEDSFQKFRCSDKVMECQCSFSLP